MRDSVTAQGQASAPGPVWDTSAAVACAQDLVPRIRERVGRCEQLRQIPDETIDELRSSGVLRALVPRRLGGAGLGFETIVRVGAELATACSSTGWIYGVFAGHNWILSLFPEAAQKEILTDPLTLTASVLRCGAKVTPVEGGYRLTNALGRFCSGVDHADWIILGISIERSSAPAEARLCLVPAAEVEVIDDWHTLGMCGTGSRSIRIADTFVPEYRTCVLADLMRGAALERNLIPTARL